VDSIENATLLEYPYWKDFDCLEQNYLLIHETIKHPLGSSQKSAHGGLEIL
jgi:hypothetical protein